MKEATDGTGWRDPDQVREYLGRMPTLPPRAAGEQALVETLPAAPARVLDLGCGDGRIAAIVMAARPSVERVVAVDNSPPMLELARERFTGDDRVTVLAWDLRDPLGAFGGFDVVVSAAAIHHLADERKRDLYREVADMLSGDGSFANLDVVASATPRRHAEFLAAIGKPEDDPEDRLAPVEAQLGWLRDAGLHDVDCLWRWRGLALLAGNKPVRS